MTADRTVTKYTYKEDPKTWQIYCKLSCRLTPEYPDFAPKYMQRRGAIRLRIQGEQGATWFF